MQKSIYSQRHVAFYEIQNRGVRAVDLRDLKTFLHLAESRHFGRSARAMHHLSPSTLFAPDPTSGRGPRRAAVRAR